MRYRTLCAAVLIALCYGRVLAHLFYQWIHVADLSFGILFPPFVFYVLYRQRQKLAAIPPAPSWTGLAVVLLGLVVLSIGILHSVWSLSGISFLIVLAGCIVFFE